MFQVALTGLLTGLALIVAVGAQNAFLLRQGIRGEQVVPIVLTCLVSDVVAINASVSSTARPGVRAGASAASCTLTSPLQTLSPE